MPFQAYYLVPDDTLKSDLSRDEVKAALESGQGLLWLDITETTEEDGQFLAETFKFHQLTIEDTISPLIHPPKVDDLEDYLFIIVHGINHLAESDIVETAELGIFLGKNYIVSAHNFPLFSVQEVKQMVERDARPMKRGPDFLAHTLMDTLIDNILPTIDKMSDIAEEIEEETIRSPRQTTLESILKLKRSILRVHRVMVPQREVFNRLSRREFKIISDEAQIFYRDVYDHIVRIEDLNQGLRDRADNALATHLASVANKQNETMKVLSIVAAIFLPLSLIAGIYGMNFKYMPELEWGWGYFAVLGFMLMVVSIVIWRFWASNWIAWGGKQVKRANLFAVDPLKLVGHLGSLTNLAKRALWRDLLIRERTDEQSDKED
ncbi:magnesium/cobalt transporter CorA [Chloroflexota bacterium]